jgi:hypothetical protein
MSHESAYDKQRRERQEWAARATDEEKAAKRKAEEASATYERIVRQRRAKEQKEKQDKTIQAMIAKYGSLEACVLDLLATIERMKPGPEEIRRRQDEFVANIKHGDTCSCWACN